MFLSEPVTRRNGRGSFDLRLQVVAVRDLVAGWRRPIGCGGWFGDASQLEAWSNSRIDPSIPRQRFIRGVERNESPGEDLALGSRAGG